VYRHCIHVPHVLIRDLGCPPKPQHGPLRRPHHLLHRSKQAG
jgi:hypothetical protein